MDCKKSCCVYIKTNIYTIVYTKRQNEKMYFIFIGEKNKSYSNIFTKLEQFKDLLKTDINILETVFENYFKTWMKLSNNKIYIKFIYNRIKKDDNIIEIKDKIFLYLSIPNNNIYFYPNNLQLWFKNNKNNLNILGYTYEDIKNEPIINVTKITKNSDLIKYKKNT